MGDWNINIQGTGCHHNGKPEIDADLASIEFVKALRAQGHVIRSATFTSGTKTCLLEKANQPTLVTDQVGIVINGRLYLVSGAAISYESVRALAGLSGFPTVTYRKTIGKDSERSGILSAGGSVSDIGEMIFSVAHTGSA